MAFLPLTLKENEDSVIAGCVSHPQQPKGLQAMHFFTMQKIQFKHNENLMKTCYITI